MTLSLEQLVLRYTAFAILATGANLMMQRLSLSIYSGSGSVALAIFLGTGIGLALKYLLDKRWIFSDHRNDLATHGRLFALYTAMGILTTIIFWSTEYAFWLIWQTQTMREIGAVLGLAVGYVTKYQFDKRFVFVQSQDSTL